MGFITSALALLPPILANQDLKLATVTDRFALPPLIGISLMVTGAIFTFVVPRARPWIIALLVGIAVMTHFNNANYYRNVWNMERDLWWQMYWRAPMLKPETVLVASVPPKSFFPSDTYEVWSPANLIYSPNSTEPSIYGVRLAETVADKIALHQDYDYQVLSAIHFDMKSGQFADFCCTE